MTQHLVKNNVSSSSYDVLQAHGEIIDRLDEYYIAGKGDISFKQVFSDM